MASQAATRSGDAVGGSVGASVWAATGRDYRPPITSLAAALDPRIRRVTRYGLIAVDVDGTLLTSKGVISPRTRDALHAAVAGGVHLAVATGRRRSTAQPILEQLGVKHFLVAS